MNFNDADLVLFEHELSMVIPPAGLLELNHVNVGSDGIIFRPGRILAESFNYRHEFNRWISSRNLLQFFVRNYAFRTRRRLDDLAFWITDNWGCAYFHWLLDALPRLYVIRDQLPDGVLLLPNSCRNVEYVASSLAPFGLKDIQYVGGNEIMHCRKLLIPSHIAPSGNYNEIVIQALRHLYRTHYSQKETRNSCDKIYISRSKATKRRITNENEVIEVVRAYGFSVVCFEDYPFQEQVEMMLPARYVVANHGAGLANMLFLPEKSSVFELRKFGDGHSNCYFNLASALHLESYYQLCKAENPDEDAGSANVFVDLKLFRENLELMLSAN
jgi:capsular polysaccharide biosynthesis protein